ncbi:hypothetical protein B0H13DRAFT_1891091 [Mycena leptocephala]|nr:hypothetical protein B0H13DRAFT_1891091 [Mycena leptocephala]
MTPKPAHIEHAVVAASTLKQLSEISPIPYLKVVAGNVKTNRAQCLAMIDEIDELLCAIIDLCVETSGAIPFVLLESMAKFSELVFPILAHIPITFSRTLQKYNPSCERSRKWAESSGFYASRRIRKLDPTLVRPLLTRNEIKSSATVLGNLAELSVNEDRKHHELISLLVEQESDQASSILSDYSTDRIRGFRDSSSTLSLLLPPAPQIFHGRDSELNEIVDALMQRERALQFWVPQE